MRAHHRRQLSFSLCIRSPPPLLSSSMLAKCICDSRAVARRVSRIVQRRPPGDLLISILVLLPLAHGRCPGLFDMLGGGLLCVSVSARSKVTDLFEIAAEMEGDRCRCVVAQVCGSRSVARAFLFGSLLAGGFRGQAQWCHFGWRQRCTDGHSRSRWQRSRGGALLRRSVRRRGGDPARRAA